MAQATSQSGLVCVISGANRGIGLELTRQLLNQGARVYAGARSPETSKALQSLSAESQGRLKVFALDVTSSESIAAFAGQVDADHVDLLLNNAGILLDSDTDWSGLDAKTLAQSFAVNSIGPVLMTQAFLPRLKKSADPKVANITSQMGSIADNSGGGTFAYRMSKAALNMFTKCLSIDEGGLTTLCLHPGWVQTEMGGSHAPVPVEKSAQGLLKVILSATREDSGRFLRFDGQSAPW